MAVARVCPCLRPKGNQISGRRKPKPVTDWRILMKKLPLMAAIAALSLYGCASQSANTREASSPEAGAMGGAGTAGTTDTSGGIDSSSDSTSQELPGETGNVSDLEKRDRMDAPTVYEGEATGGSGAADDTVKTKDGQKWDVQQNTPTDLGDSQVPQGAVNQNRNPAEKGNLGTGGSGMESQSEVRDEDTGEIQSDVDAPSTDSNLKADDSAAPAN
jgi:hypothetical protein